MSKYYTYALIDPRDSQPFYIGKGTQQRMYQHVYRRKTLANYLLKRRITEIIKAGHEVQYRKLVDSVGEEEALLEEQRAIREYGRLDIGTGILCNLTNGGECGATSWSPQTRERKRQLELAKKKGRPVNQYTLGGEFVAKYSSAKVASENTPANRSYITQVCKGKRKSAGGYLWAYEGNPTPTYSKEYYRAVHQYDLEENLLTTFHSLTEAQKQTGVELHNISECCRKNSKTAGGFVWKYSP